MISIQAVPSLQAALQPRTTGLVETPNVQNQETKRPRQIIEEIERSALVPAPEGKFGYVDRFAGYSVIGLPFSSGHVLALRRFPASSVGPGYTSVWHRDPQGHWTFYSTVPPEQACTRYFGIAVERDVVAPIRLEWLSSSRLLVVIQGMLAWEMKFGESRASRFMNAAAARMPESWWTNSFVLRAMGVAARLAFGAGKINMTGRTPNGHRFIANPRRVWVIESSRAFINGVDAGPVGPLPEQARLRDFVVPQKGIFAVARVFLEPGPGSSDNVATQRLQVPTAV